MKNNNGLLNGLIIFVAVLIIYSGIVYILNKQTEEKAEYNKCVRILINEDYIENGCDKYFINDKWYKDFMKQMFDEYKEMK